MKNRKIIYWILILLLLTAAITGTSFAYMFKQTEYKNNQFIPANVSCVVYEKTDNDTDVTNIKQKTSITVKNTGNIPAYIRVRLVTYWVKDIGEGRVEITGRASEMPKFSTVVGWGEGVNNTYYYKKAIEPNTEQELLSAPIILAKDGDYLQVVEVFAEAIQSKPTSAVESAWPVTLASDGTINSIN